MRGLLPAIALLVAEFDAHFGAGAARREYRAVTSALLAAALLAFAVAAMFEDLGG